jgi:hypothetical protein
MAQSRSYESPTTTPIDRTDGTETRAPSADAFTDEPVAPSSRSGPNNWGVSARWFLLALLAIAFFFCLSVLRH